MKRFYAAVVLCACLASSASAVFTFDRNDVLSFSRLADYTYETDSDALFVGAFDNSIAYEAPLPANSIGLVARGIGRNVALSGGTIEWIGLGATGLDMTGQTSMYVLVNNDDDDPWKYKLFVDGGTTGSQVVSPTWVTIASGGSATLMLDFSGLGTGSRAGLMIGSDLREDTLHTSITIPAPAAVLLSGLGAGMVGWLRRRRAL